MVKSIMRKKISFCIIILLTFFNTGIVFTKTPQLVLTKPIVVNDGLHEYGREHEPVNLIINKDANYRIYLTLRNDYENDFVGDIRLELYDEFGFKIIKYLIEKQDQIIKKEEIQNFNFSFRGSEIPDGKFWLAIGVKKNSAVEYLEVGLDSGLPYPVGIFSGENIYPEKYLFGIIDKSGKWVLPPKYENMFLAGDGIYVVNDNSIIEPNEKTFKKYPEFIIKKSINNFLAVKKGGKYGVITFDRDSLISFEYNRVFSSSNQGLFLIKNDGQEISFMNFEGRITIKYTGNLNDYDNYTVSEGLVTICKEGKYGYYTTEGQEVIAPKYSYAKPFSEGMAVVNNTQYIDKTGNLRIDLKKKYPEIEIANRFSEGFAVVKNKKGFRYINKNGNYAFTLIADYASSFNEGYAVIGYRDTPQGEITRYTYIDAKGRYAFVQEPKSSFQKWLLKNRDRYTFLYALLAKKPSPKWFAGAGSFQEGFAVVNEIIISDTNQKTKRSYYIDKNGNVGIELQFKNIVLHNFHDGYAIVGVNYYEYTGKKK